MWAEGGNRPGPVVVKKMSPAQFDRGYEPLLKREGTCVYTTERTRVPSLNTGGLVCTGPVLDEQNWAYEESVYN